MSNRKSTIEDEPVWRKRRREEQKKERRKKLITALIVLVIVGFMGTTAFLTLRPHRGPRSKPAKPPIEHGIAKVVGKQEVRKEGKLEKRITFRVGRLFADMRASQSDYGKLQKGQEVLLAYDVDPLTQTPHVRGWTPLPKQKQSEGAAK